MLGFLSPSVRLRTLDISHPTLHFIVYSDGSTNQPHPRHPQASGTHNLDTLFNLKAGRISVEQGIVDYDNRAAAFDFQDRREPFDFQASNVSVLLRYMAATAAAPQTYRIEAGANDLSLTRGIARRAKSVHGYFQATLDLTHTEVSLHSLRLTSRTPDGSHVLDITGSLQDFSHPRWQAKVKGDLDMRLLDPVLGYPFAPQGIARLDLDAAGQDGEFRTDGPIHIDGGSYIGTGVVATGVRLDAHVHADPAHLLISSIVIQLRQGGQIQGTVDLSPWLHPVHGESFLEASSPSATPTARKTAPVRPKPPSIPVNGKVTALFKDVTLDTILDMVSQPPFQRLGFAALLNGPATATWFNGDTKTVAVTTDLNLSPASHLLAGELPASGIVDGTYTQRNGAVDLRKLQLNLPASQLQAYGNMGSTSIDQPLRAHHRLPFHQPGRVRLRSAQPRPSPQRQTGTAALPITLSGQADFHGTWAGSLANPRIGGNLKATQLALEIPSAPSPAGSPSAPSQSVHFDSVDAAGSYSSTKISVDRGLLLRAGTRIALSGTLAANLHDSTPSKIPVFDADSLLHLRLEAAKVGVDDLQPFLARKLPFTGALDADLQADGPVRSLRGSGWVELNSGSIYGEPVFRLRAQGTIANNVVNLPSVVLTHAAGSFSATGSYNLKSRVFQVDAKGAGLDISRIDWLHRQGWPASGKLAFSVRGSGVLDDPQLQANATLSNLTLGGESIGALEFVAHTANRSLAYDLTTRLDSTELTVHGQTALNGDYETQTRMEFSRFNIDSLLKLAHVKAFSGQSSLAGAVTVEGPLAHTEQLRGEARLQQLEATIAGVHLKSEGAVHATLGANHIRLDPLHITGENTDLRLQGSLALNGVRQLDLAASGSVNLKLAETLDPDLTAGGTSTFTVEAHGPLKNPGLQGRVDFQNGSLSFEDIPNGLSQLHGTLEFNQDRLEVKSLTAMSGGGPLSVGGYLAYQHGIYADLSVTGQGVRIRYPQGVSSLADATLHLQGPQNNLQLSGNILITRFTVSPDLDFAALAAEANSAPTISAPDAASNHIRFDVRILSSPQLNFQNAFAKLAGDVDLRLRGTVANPSLQGRVSITDGSAVIAGTRYDLQRGEISFTNPVRIEPVIDLSATARVEDYDITLDLHGTPSKPSVTYRSDPPLPESDVVALLALGRTQNQQRIYTQQQQQALSNPTTDALLGGALNATVSSRIQKLFGAGSVKVDPNYLGPFGNSTSRIIVEEQLGRNLTLTYATDVNTTGQQLLQAEIAINRHVSLLVSRDESGVFSMVVKATRRFR